MFRLGIVRLVVSLPGVFLLAALDSTFFFSLPFGIDGAIVLLSARHVAPVWAVTLVATAGSMLGAALTFWTGTKLGETGIGGYISPSMLTRIRRRLQGQGAALVALLDLVPPPFPFSLFVLAAGAAKLDRRQFFGILALCRLVRFGGEALLGAMYGQRVLDWFDSEIAHVIVIAIVVLATVLSLVSIVRLVSFLRSHRRRSLSSGG